MKMKEAKEKCIPFIHVHGRSSTLYTCTWPLIFLIWHMHLTKVCNKSNTRCASSGAGIAYPSLALDFSHVFMGLVLLDLKFSV